MTSQAAKKCVHHKLGYYSCQQRYKPMWISLAVAEARLRYKQSIESREKTIRHCDTCRSFIGWCHSSVIELNTVNYTVALFPCATSVHSSAKMNSPADVVHVAPPIIIQYSSFKLHQSCMCFHGVLMHN